jgi:hypothetical protein
MGFPYATQCSAALPHPHFGDGIGQCERFDFDGKRLALEALDIQVTANGREWHLDGRIPVDDVGVVTQISGRCDHLQAIIMLSYRR